MESRPTPGIPTTKGAQETRATEIAEQPRKTRRRPRGGRRGKSRKRAAAAAISPAAAVSEPSLSDQVRNLTRPRGSDLIENPPPPISLQDPQLPRSAAEARSAISSPDTPLPSALPELPETAAPMFSSETVGGSPVFRAMAAGVGCLVVLIAVYSAGYVHGSGGGVIAHQDGPPQATNPVSRAASMSESPRIDQPLATAPEPPPETIIEPPAASAPDLETEQPVAVASGFVDVGLEQAAAPKPSPLAAPATPAVGLFLQVSALEQSAAAEELRRRLAAQGFRVHVIEPSDDGLIRVLVGPFQTRDQANEPASRLRSQGLAPFPKNL